MGSRLPSRRGSIASVLRRSIGSRGENSIVGPLGEGDESIVSNAPLSRRQTIDGRSDSQKENVNPDGPTARDFAHIHGAPDAARQDTPFTQEDLSLALKRSHLQVPS
jgi:hypothetical protein